MKNRYLLVAVTSALFAVSSSVLMADSGTYGVNSSVYQQITGSQTFNGAKTACSGRNRSGYTPGHLAQVATATLLNLLTTQMKNGTGGWVNQNSWSDGALMSASTVKWYNNALNNITSTGVIQVSGGATITGYNANMPNPTTNSLSINTSSQLVLKTNTTVLPYFICQWELMSKKREDERKGDEHKKGDEDEKNTEHNKDGEHK